MSKQMIALNEYQQLMLNITDLAPYNAVHAVMISEKVSHIQLQSALNDRIQHLALGAPEFSKNRRLVTFVLPIEPILVDQRFDSLEAHMTREINLPFAPDVLPLRFYIITEGAQEYFVVTYNHWIADAYAIMRLVDAIVCTALAHQWDHPLSLSAPKMALCFPKVYGKMAFYNRYWGVLKNLVHYSRAYRYDIGDIESTQSGCYHYVFSETELTELLKICKKQDITLNDLFVVVLAQLFGKLTAEKRKGLKSKYWKPKRDRIVISIISDMRKQSAQPLQECFGVFLGFFSLFFKAPERYTFEQLKTMVSAKINRLKRHNTAIKQSILWGFQNNLWIRQTKRASQYRLYSKNAPITVGISNVLLQTEHLLYSRYIRCSPTAMVCPIVFNITTCHLTMSLSMTYRQTCYTDQEAHMIKETFILNLRQLIQQSCI